MSDDGQIDRGTLWLVAEGPASGNSSGKQPGPHRQGRGHEHTDNMAWELGGCTGQDESGSGAEARYGKRKQGRSSQRPI